MKKKPIDDSQTTSLMTENAGYNMDKALKQIGGFGLYQWLLVLALTVLRNGGNYLYYGFGFLTMQQEYLC
jgi:hypothetical protein